MGVAGLLIACSFMAVRLNALEPRGAGPVDPNLHELQTAFTDHRLTFSYVPSFFECQVTVAMVAMGCAMFTSATNSSR